MHAHPRELADFTNAGIAGLDLRSLMLDNEAAPPNKVIQNLQLEVRKRSLNLAFSRGSKVLSKLYNTVAPKDFAGR